MLVLLTEMYCNKLNTHFMLYIYLFENHSHYAIMWKCNVQPDRPQMTTWHMRIACLTSKAKHTLRICNILLCFHYNNAWTNEILFYMYIACLVSFEFQSLSNFL